MEGILVWAVEGARRLVESSGVFTRVASSDAIISEYKETNNRVKMFIEHGGVIVSRQYLIEDFNLIVTAMLDA